MFSEVMQLVFVSRQSNSVKGMIIDDRGRCFEYLTRLFCGGPICDDRNFGGPKIWRN